MSFYMNFKYSRMDSVIRIDSYTSSATSVNIPAWIDGLPVTSIGNEAFWGCSSLTNIEIPDSVMSIGANAFKDCKNLKSIAFPSKIKYIGERAFENCRLLKSITIPEGLQSIGEGAFTGCNGLKNITIPDSVTAIGEAAFSCCKNLTSITISEGINSIGTKIFADCNKLNNIYLHESLKYVEGTDNTLKFFINEYGSKIHYYNLSHRISSKIDNLKNNSNISAELLNLVNQMELSLTKNYVPELNDSIIKFLDDIERAYRKQQKIDNNTVANLISLLGEISNKKIKSTAQSVEKKKKRTPKVKSDSNDSTVPLSTKPVKKKRKFKLCPECGTENPANRKKCKNCGVNISEVIPTTDEQHKELMIFPASAPSSDFDYASNFFNVTITKYKGSSDFINIPSQINGLPVTKIGGEAFFRYSSLTSIIIPDSITYIGWSAFSWCDNLKSVKSSKYITFIGQSAFHGCSSLESIKIPKGVTSIEDLTFAGCRSLTSITIPENIKSIGWSAFNGCSSLKSIKILEGIIYINKIAFAGCRSLTSISIPESVTYIGDDIFAGCTSLKTIYFPNSLRNARGDNNTLKRFRNEYSDKISYYQTTKTIEVPDFWRNNSAESQTEAESNFKYSITESGIHIYKYIGRNNFVVIPEKIEGLSVSTIGYRAFENDNLYKVVIPASVKSIAYYAFVSKQPMHILFKGGNIQMAAKSFLAPNVTFYYTNNGIAGILYGIADNNPGYNVNFNEADFYKV